MWNTISGFDSAITCLRCLKSQMSPVIDLMPDATDAVSNKLGEVGGARE
jgi:hypothetical protein